MRRTILFLFLANSFAFGQISYSVMDTIDVYKPKEAGLGESYFQIPVDFSADDLLKVIPKDLTNVSIQRIDLVYTIFKTSPDFDQKKLNDNRVKSLLKVWPAAKYDLIEWNEFGQSQAKNSDAAKAMFHGFYVYYRPTPTKESMDAEIAFLDELFYGTSGIVSTSETTKSISDGSREDIAIDKKRDELKPELTLTPNVLNSKSELVQFADYTTGGIACFESVKQKVFNEVEFETARDSVMKLEGFYGYSSLGLINSEMKKPIDVIWYFRLDSCDVSSGRSSSGFAFMGNQDYGIVEEVFNRNPSWTNSLVVMDVTGSMSQYIAKTMTWVKATQKDSKIHAFVFFNDGDLKYDHTKVIGKVGGIYHAKNENFDEVYKVMKTTMKNGGGGDCPENNIEATLFGVQNYADCKEVIMVADNWATPRDLSLVSKLNVPVHIVLCGAGFGVNIEYIQLAIDTGGSIHTIEQDLDAKSIKPGIAFEFGNAYYTIVNGRVVKAENK